MRTLLDTGPLVALLNQRDFHHEWSVKRAGEMPPPFYTCEAVLTEAHFLLGRAPHGRARLTDMLSTGKIELTTLVLDNLDRVGKLMHTYSNVPMAFADACLVCKITGSTERVRSNSLFLDAFGDGHLARSLMAEGEFLEIFVDTPLGLCEAPAERAQGRPME